jgi:hypothetical protein
LEAFGGDFTSIRNSKVHSQLRAVRWLRGEMIGTAWLVRAESAWQQVVHSDCPKLTILQPVRVPHLGRLNVAMAQKVSDFKDCCAHVEQP